MHNILSASLLSKNVKTVIVPVVLFGCKTCSVTLRGKHRLIVFENRVHRKLIAPKKDEVAGEGWRRLRNEELYDFYFSPNVIRVVKSRKMRWAGHLARMGENWFCWGNLGERDLGGG
jgi:hypothetical protein